MTSPGDLLAAIVVGALLFIFIDAIWGDRR